MCGHYQEYVTLSYRSFTGDNEALQMVQWGARPFGPLPDSRHSTRASEGALDFQTTSDSSTQHSDGTYPSSQEYPRAHRQFSSTSLPAIEHQMGSSRYDLPTFHDMPSEVYTHGSGSALGRGTGETVFATTNLRYLFPY